MDNFIISACDQLGGYDIPFLSREEILKHTQFDYSDHAPPFYKRYY